MEKNVDIHCKSQWVSILYSPSTDSVCKTNVIIASFKWFLKVLFVEKLANWSHIWHFFYATTRSHQSQKFSQFHTHSRFNELTHHNKSITPLWI